ncbi:ergothioneine biosynthesis glutamate--cysteine ligase EgtA [Mycobacterium kiyosense]|nr:glutamate--cysteine ligase EgtA [Mycobacterium kiyosense]
MTHSVAPQLDQDRLPVTELADSAAAAHYITRGCFTDGRSGRVGLEVEAHCFDPGAPARRPGWEEITDVLDALPPLPGGSAFSVEPGGAVELSGPPAEGVLPAVGAMATDQAVLRSAFGNAGLGLVLLGTEPLREPERVNPGARYRAMERFFVAGNTAAAGAAMMTSTASIQINLDAGPQARWAARLRLAHALGPTMIAITANSPLLRGKFSGWVSTRQQVWGRLGSARCGPIQQADCEDPASSWARYALNAPVMLVHAPDAVAVRRRVSFADWADGRVLLGGRRPNTADLDYHLTTLFPPVRPRGRLEIRYLDSVPDVLWPAEVFTLVTLLDDPVAAEAAAEAVEPVAAGWETAARIGLADRRLRAAAERCVAIAAERVPAELEDAMSRLIRNVERGRCPAHDLTDRVMERGITATVAELAHEGW